MRITIQNNSAIISSETDVVSEFIVAFNQNYESLRQNHIIIQLEKSLPLEHINMLSKIAASHNEAQKSFVLQSNMVDIDSIPNDLNIVPTLQEAFDIIDMESMARDLGF